MIAKFISLAEQGKLPDKLVRFGIRRLCEQRLRDEARGDAESQQNRFQALIENLRESPIAIETDAANEALSRIRDHADDNQQHRILIDCAGLSPLQTEMVRFFTGEAIAALLRHPYKTVAILPREMINKFTENVAVNRGATFHVTHDFDAGLGWLLS